MKPIISISEARKTLGKDADTMSDEQIAQTIDTLSMLAKEALDTAKKRNQPKPKM